ncbi:MAG: hypothetical protein ACHREM_25890 [Polyangiales bacterium]
MRPFAFLLGAVVAVSSMSSLAGCQQPKQETRVASSSGLAGYAVDFPIELDRTFTSFEGRQDEVRAILERLATYGDQLKSADAIAVARRVVNAAEDSGRAWAYVERAHEVEGVGVFMDEEGKTISGRIGGAAQFEAKKKECEANVYGAAASALQPAVEKQEEKRMRARNDAFLIIERERGPLTKEDVAVLEKLADDVARASFLVNVDLTDREIRLRRLVQDSDAVKETIDRAIKDEKAYAAEEGRTDADKKASDARLKAAEKARDALAETTKKVKKADKDGALDKKVSLVQGDYDAAMDALRKKLKGKKS